MIILVSKFNIHSFVILFPKCHFHLTAVEIERGGGRRENPSRYFDFGGKISLPSIATYIVGIVILASTLHSHFFVFSIR